MKFNEWCINEWCTGCKEYDTEKHCCPRFNNVIRHTLNECINERLDKIAKEIALFKDYPTCTPAEKNALRIALQIIDKYKAESEEE